MKTKTIVIKSDLKKQTLRQHLSVFFRKTKFKTQYIFVLVKISADAGKKDFILGNKMLLDVRNKEEVKTYKSTIVRKFSGFSTQHKVVPSDNLTFFYVDSDKATFEKNMEAVAKADNFNLDAFS